MKTKNIKCIILGHKNFFEQDKIIYFYNDELGKIQAIAKGARKLTSKFTGHLETLNFCTATIYFGSKINILTEIATDETSFRKRNNLKTISNALQIAKITSNILYENQNLEKLSELLRTTIKHLKTSRKKSLITTAYTIKLLDKFGTIPDLKETKTSLQGKYLKFFNFIKTKPFSEIEKITLTKKEKQYIENFTQELLERVTSH
jgi:DNA repair protein RecO (recombination protein O)